MADTRDSSAPVPVSGDVTHRIRTVRRGITRATIVTAATIASLTAGIVLWATSELGQKADAAAVMQLGERVRLLEPRVAAFDRDLQWLKSDTAWIKAALWQMAQRGGVVVPPPPVGALTPLAAPESPP